MTVHLLGIRHHGPGSARSVLRALEEIRPDIVLVEAPADVDAALRWVGEPGLEPPVALLTYVPAEPGRAAFAPFATFSPEWQAIRWANEHGIEVHAIDLPLAVTLAGEGDDSTSLVAEVAPPDPLRELRPRPALRGRLRECSAYGGEGVGVDRNAEVSSTHQTVADRGDVDRHCALCR